MSAFDPDTFLSQQTTEALDTTSTPIPEGVYPAVVDKIVPRQAKGSTILDVIWSIDDEGVKTVTGLQKNTARQSIFLDMTESGALDFSKGKNVQLGRLRDALNQNTPGHPWAPGMLVGNVARVSVKHRLGDNGQTYVDVKEVARM